MLGLAAFGGDWRAAGRARNDGGAIKEVVIPLMTTSGMHDLRCTGAAGNLPNSAELGLEYSNLRRYRTITECASCSDHISVKDPA